MSSSRWEMPASPSCSPAELLYGLARDLGIIGEAQSDAPTLAVDLDHAHGDLIVAAEHGLHAVHALSRTDVGDVQQPIGALGELDEGSERGRLDHLAHEL